MLGAFNKYGILTAYLALGVVVVDGAFQRHFPVYLGSDQKERAFEVAAVAKWWYMLLVYVGIVVFGGLTLRSLLNQDFEGVFGWLVQIPAYASATYGLYLRILYRSNDDFNRLNKNMVITSLVGIVGLPLVYFFKFSGLAVRSFFQNISNVWIHISNAPYQIKAKFDLQGLTSLAKVSLPLQIPVYLDNHLLKASISLVILERLGEEALGIYAMAIMLQGFLMVFSRSLNQIFTTKTMLNYGKHESLSEGFRYILNPTLFAIGSGVLIVVLFDLAVPILVSNFLPKYTASVVVVQILALELVLALARGPFTLFISALLYREMIYLRILKALLAFALVLSFNGTLIEIVLAIIAAEVLYVIIGYIILWLKIQSECRDVKNNL